MPTKIRISGEIGWDVTARSILEEIDAARGDDLEIEIASVGGSVFQGTEIANGIRSYKRSHPSAQILITITGLAASMASYIASVDVADLVVAYDNAVGMYHNPSTIAIGDYRDMRQKAAFLQGLTTLMRKAYATRSGKSTDDIAKMMDDTTWLFGDQLREEGFVDEIIPAPDSEENNDPESAVASAQLRFTEMISEQRSRGLKEDETRVAAVFQEVIRTTGQSQDAERTQRPPVAISHGANQRNMATSTMDSKAVVDGSKTTPAGPVGKGEKRMNLEELRATHPETYAQAKRTGSRRNRSVLPLSWQ
jgi:ATP-dependent protease ClpP protease subunit